MLLRRQRGAAQRARGHGAGMYALASFEDRAAEPARPAKQSVLIPRSTVIPSLTRSNVWPIRSGGDDCTRVYARVGSCAVRLLALRAAPKGKAGRNQEAAASSNRTDQEECRRRVGATFLRAMLLPCAPADLARTGRWKAHAQAGTCECHPA